MQPIYSTILFDFDGTLTSSLELWLRAFHYAFAKFDQKVTDKVIIERCFYRAFADVVDEFNLPSAIEFGQMVKEGLSIVFEEAVLFSGVQEVLLACANQNIKLAVVTSSPRTIVAKTLKSLGIDSFFSTIVTADDIVNFKPHPEPVLLALTRLGSLADETLVIGDSQADMLAGQAAGIKTGLFYPDVHKQFYDLQKLKETQPHFIFHHYNDLHQHLFDILTA
jgi:pyrophosphatase PpaX